MTEVTYKKSLGLFLWSYAATLGTAVYFSKALSTVHPPYFLMLGLAVLGLLLCGLFLLLFRGRADEMKHGSKATLFFIFQIIQGGLGFVLARFLFNLTWLGALAYPAGAVIACTAWWVLTLGLSKNIRALGLLALLGGGTVISLRIAAVPGALMYGLAFLNSFWLGASFLKKDSELCEVWLRAIFFVSLLVVGRAVIQFYLLKSNYANLGVVITHSYTYAALFAGFFLPLIVKSLQKENTLPPLLQVILLGILLPLILGFFFHVRPMGGYLLGLVTSSFLLGILVEENYLMGLIAYLNLGAVAFGLPLFKHFNNLSRVVRIEVLGGLLLLSMIGYFILRMKGNPSPKTT